MNKIHLEFTVNGRKVELLTAPNRTLLEVIREDLGLTGTKQGCGLGDCGTCTVILDGHPVNSCLVLAPQAHGRKVETIEGLDLDGQLHPLQAAFIEKGAIQCGYCTSGMILSAKALLTENPNPDETQIRTAISGNLCRCTGYQKIVEAIESSVEQQREGEPKS